MDEVLYGEHGEIMLERQGTQMNLQLVQDNSGGVKVAYNDKEYGYKEFLANELARLELFAKKIKQHDRCRQATAGRFAQRGRMTMAARNGIAAKMMAL